MAIKEQIEKGNLKGTVIFYGLLLKKQFLQRFGWLEVSLINLMFVWIGIQETQLNQGLNLVKLWLILFHLMAVPHASSDPWNGRSAVDAMELIQQLNYYREHILPTSRIHYQFEAAGDVVNVVPDYAKMWTRLRGNSVEHVNVLYDRALDIAKAASMMTGTSYETKLISGIYEILVNRRGLR